MRQIVIGLVGPIASGKGTVIKILEKKGFSSYSLSDRIREEIRRNGQEVTRDTLHVTSNKMRVERGSDILAKLTSELIDKDSSDKIIIDAIRNPAEIEYLKQKYAMRLVGVDGPQAKRFKLLKARNAHGDPMTWEEFLFIDNHELVNEDGAHTQQVAKSLEMADVVIQNDGTLEELEEKINETLKSLNIKD